MYLFCTLDPAFAPATGTPEPGGWSMREMKRLLRGLAGLHLMCVFANRGMANDEPRLYSGADIVEVAPAYDHGKSRHIALRAHVLILFLPADITSIAAADIVHEFLSLYIASAKPVMGRNRHIGDNSEPKGIYRHGEL